MPMRYSSVCQEFKREAGAKSSRIAFDIIDVKAADSLPGDCPNAANGVLPPAVTASEACARPPVKMKKNMYSYRR